MVLLSLLLVTITVLGAPLCRGCARDVAKGKPAHQSSTYMYEGSYNASLAVDGNYDDNWQQGSCSHTEDGQGNWWLVDLESTAILAGVVLTNRGECCSERLVNFEVRVGYSFVGTSSFTQYRLCASYPGVAPVGNTSLSCRSPLRGRYVLIIKVGSDDLPLQLCEVEVHGFPSTTTFQLVGAGARASLSPISTLNVRSLTECSISCMQHWECAAINVLCTGNGQCTCELLPSTAQSGDLQAGAGYDYYEDNCFGAV
ncbi:fucolectin [Lingula anatina]|uniref:Fucolectin n=1 Tax=Lingula anatina TaxID=7574 RepID=A0A1S3KEU6_LINAN|nr:fucolectin [Lingula anatina]|eukprot:XP_013421155.1 fucolectin [Lingula anatina]